MIVTALGEQIPNGKFKAYARIGYSSIHSCAVKWKYKEIINLESMYNKSGELYNLQICDFIWAKFSKQSYCGNGMFVNGNYYLEIANLYENKIP